MISDFIFALEPYMWIIYIFHAVISFIVAFLLSSLLVKRFVVSGEEIDAKDKRRLQEISQKSLIFKLLFRVSLHKNNRITSTLFIFLFIFAMPVIGYIFAIWIAFYLKNISYDKKVSNTNILNLDEFGISFLKVERIFGEGSMSELMNNKYAPKSKKLKALSSLSNSLSPANLRIIRSTLTSTDDEIRMYGYATINKAEKALNIKINHYLEIYQSESEKKDADQGKLANAAKELAELYWEMVYTELSHESLKTGFLEEVKSYIRVAKKYYLPKSHKLKEEIILLDEESKLYREKSDEVLRSKEVEYQVQRKVLKDKLLNYNNILTKLYLLMGKVYMNEKNYERASTEFTVAQELYEGKSSFILPYLAEIQFIMGNYSIVTSIVNKSKDLGLNSTLYPIVEQWKTS